MVTSPSEEQATQPPADSVAGDATAKPRRSRKPTSVEAAVEQAEPPAAKRRAASARKPRPAARGAASPAKPAREGQVAGSGRANKAAKVTKAAKAERIDKPDDKRKPDKRKEKLVRDSFTMPKDEFALVDQIKAKALERRRPVKKSEILRAGLAVLNDLSLDNLIKVIEALRPIKAGRPKSKS